MSELYLRYEYHVAAAQLMLAMLGMGATLTPANFAAVLRVPRGFAVGMLAQLVLVPMLALTLSKAMALSPGLAIGLILIASVPGGSMSNVFTLLARANVPLSIVLTGVTTLLCLVTTPLLLRLLAAQHLPPDFAMPARQIAFEIAFCLLGPLAIGMLVRAWLPGASVPVARWGVRGSIFCIVLIIVGAALAGRVDTGAYGARALLALLVFALLAMQVGLLSSRAARLPDADRLAIGIETTIRNTNLGVLIKASLFPAASAAGAAHPVADEVLFVVLLYGGAGLLVTVPTILLHRRRRAGSERLVETAPAD